MSARHSFAPGYIVRWCFFYWLPQLASYSSFPTQQVVSTQLLNINPYPITQWSNLNLTVTLWLPECVFQVHIVDYQRLFVVMSFLHRYLLHTLSRLSQNAFNSNMSHKVQRMSSQLKLLNYFFLFPQYFLWVVLYSIFQITVHYPSITVIILSISSSVCSLIESNLNSKAYCSVV